jgi:hypothetical protein
MRPDDFFVDADATDALGFSGRHVDQDLLNHLRREPLADHDDVEVAVPLARLVHGDFTSYGTGGGEQLSEEEMRLALRSLRTVTSRLGLELDCPFRDYSSFRSWWVNNGAHGSWQGRRDLLSGIFDPLHDQLAVMEDRNIVSSLADPITSHPRTGWGHVDTEISELRRHFANARTPQDYRNVGLDCVAVTEALSRNAYEPERHLREGEDEPTVANTKDRLDRVVEDSAPGPANARLRKLARATIEYAQHVKHSGTPTRREAGVAADAVIQLANIMRRLDDSE